MPSANEEFFSALEMQGLVSLIPFEQANPQGNELSISVADVAPAQGLSS